MHYEVAIRLTLTRGQEALIDEADYAVVSQYRWQAVWHRNTQQYQVQGYVNGRKIKLSRFLMNAPAHLDVDHINGNSLDNQRHNLRLCTNQQNHWNMRKHRNATSQYKGVCWVTRTRKWLAQIEVNGRNMRLGSFTDEREAARAYDVAATKFFGEFARLNKV